MLRSLQHAKKGGNSVLNRLMEEVGLDKDITSLKSMNNKFLGLNRLMEEKAGELGKEIELDVVDLRGLEEEVDDLEQILLQRREQSNEYIFSCPEQLNR